MPNKIEITAEAHYRPGAKVRLNVDRSNVKAMFLDSGTRSSLTVMENTGGNYQELDSIFYSLADEHIPLEDGKALVQIAWAKQGCRVLLLINHQPLAVFDFKSRTGYSRLEAKWAQHPQQWRDDVLEAF